MRPEEVQEGADIWEKGLQGEDMTRAKALRGCTPAIWGQQDD